jgi:hypothetical protein
MGHMNERLKKRWLKALRSGEYKQAQEALRGPVYPSDDNGFIDDDQEAGVGYCCLGVLCEVMGAEFDVSRVVDIDTGKVVANTWDDMSEERLDDPNLEEKTGVVVNGYLTDEEVFTKPQLKALGIPKNIQSTLIRKNDAGVSFEKIADHIERYL